MTQNQSVDVYAIMWDCNGLESLTNLSSISRNKTWAALKGEQYDGRHVNINHWVLRARYNSQRHYEIYYLSVDKSITQDELVEWFNTDPQTAVDIIRERGTQIYSDRMMEHKVLIK